MQDHAVQALKDTVRGKFDCVIALSPGAIEVVHRIKPGQVTIVPQAGDPAGFEGVTDIGQYAAAITDTVKLLHDEGIAVSLLAAPDAAVIDLAKACGADLAQLDTGIYGSAPDKASAQRELDRLYRAADHAAHVGMAITAGRGLTYDNIEAVLNAKGLADVHVGRSIVSRAASVGLALAVGEMLEILD
jgi:pyridoxine 5-phosphate synthase